MFNFLRKNIDVPFEKDVTHRFVSIIIGLMMFLATLALVMASTISSIVKEWDKSYAPGYLIEVPLKSYESRESIDKVEKDLMYALRTIIGVDKVSLIANNFSVLNSEKTAAGDSPSYLAFDITIRPDHAIDEKLVRNHVSRVRDEFKLVDHQTLRAEKINIAHVSVILGVLIALIISIAAIITIEFVTYSGLEMHKSIIDILHNLGARRQYIAAQFQNQALILSLKGGIIGCVTSGCLLFGLSFLAGQIDVDFVKAGIQNSPVITIILLTPLLGLILSTLTARITVLSALNKRA